MGIIKIKFARSISPDYKDQTIIPFIKDVLINNHLPNKECIAMEAFFFQMNKVKNSWAIKVETGSLL